MAIPKTRSRSRIFIETGKAICSEHGEHSNWAVVKAGKGVYDYARCRYCCNIKDTAWKAKALELDPVKFKLYRIVSQSRKRDKEFNLTKEVITSLFEKQEYKCALTGQPISEHNFSVDRIDSSKGYVLENIWLTTVEANYAKQTLSLDDFIQLCRNVVAIHGSK